MAIVVFFGYDTGSKQEGAMAKSRDIRKETKKKPAKSIKEKRKEKLEKKSK